MKRPPDDMRARLLDMSARILAEPDLRLEDIAADVGVARTTLYYYFSGRDDLVSFILIEHLRDAHVTITTASTSGETPAVRLRAAVVAILTFLSSHPGICTGLLGSLGSSGQLAEALHANETYVAQPLRALVEAAMRAGKPRRNDSDDVTNAMLGAILMVVVGRTMTGKPLDQPQLERTADMLVAMQDS